MNKENKINHDDSIIQDNTDSSSNKDFAFDESSTVELMKKNYPQKKKSYENKNNILFKTRLISKKRGRKSKKKGNKRVHSSTDLDNVMRKIQVHFLGEVANFTNDVVYFFTHDKKKRIFKFNYTDKKNVKHDYVESLKNCNIKELILKLKASPKYKGMKSNSNKNINEPTLNDLTKYSWFNEFINKSFSDIFKIYFNNQKYINIEGRRVDLNKTKSFQDLLEKSEESEKALVEVAEKVYLNSVFSFSGDSYNSDSTK